MEKGLRDEVQNVQRLQNDIREIQNVKRLARVQKACSCSMACYHVDEKQFNSKTCILLLSYAFSYPLRFHKDM
jgi:hypothetical protein